MIVRSEIDQDIDVVIETREIHRIKMEEYTGAVVVDYVRIIIQPGNSADEGS